MKVALVSMPWSTHGRPSAAVGALTAYLRRERPDLEVVGVSAYVTVADTIGFPLYELISERAYSMGELLYACLLYPERRDSARAYFAATLGCKNSTTEPGSFGPFDSWDALFDRLLADLETHLEHTAEQLGGDFDVVGLTTCFGQTFANLALCTRIKARSPRTITLLGGSSVSDRVGPSFLAEYASVDAIVQGEGELPLVSFVDAVAAGRPWPDLPGVRHRDVAEPKTPRLWEVPDMAALPVPDFDEYAELATSMGIDWHVPIEGSRGCWWDRTKRTQDPKSTCHFCNLNVQWNGYREKPVARVVEELDTLTERYTNTRVFFLDNIIRQKGALELAQGLAALGKDFELFYELRASTRPEELLALWEAGLRRAQFGIEGLSTTYLRHMGKGTSTLQNLQAMKLCKELGVENLANLIVGFPGSTAAHVEESRANILRYALPYEPCNTTSFFLGVGSTYDVLRERLGITNIRNRSELRAAIPDDVWSRLSLFDLDFDHAGEQADWTPVTDAVAHWRKRQREVGEPLLSYYDGRTFVTIVDRRVDHEVIKLHGLLREVFLQCGVIRARGELERLFPDESRAAIDDAIDELAEDALVFVEGEKLLSLPLAQDARVASARLRKLTAAATERPAAVREVQPERPRLRVLGAVA